MPRLVKYWRGCKMMKIVLNPGHLSTDDRGFLGPETEGGNNKKTVALIKKYLDDYDCEVVIVAQDDGVPFSQLGLKHPDATLFYSHHTNAYNGKARGTEVFFHYSRSLAENIAHRTAEILQTVTRGEKGAKKNNNYYAVINQAVKAGVKYQLMGEIGFHDNPKENKLIVEKREEIARAIAEEIVKYLKLKKKEVKPVKKDLDVAQKWAVDSGIMQDKMWDEPATRHQMAWWLFDLYKKFIKEK